MTPAQCIERSSIAQAGHLSVKVKPTFLERLPNITPGQVSEPAAQDLHGQKRGLFPAAGPTSAVLSSEATNTPLQEGPIFDNRVSQSARELVEGAEDSLRRCSCPGFFIHFAVPFTKRA